MGSGETINLKREERDFQKTERLRENRHALTHTRFELKKTEVS